MKRCDGMYMSTSCDRFSHSYIRRAVLPYIKGPDAPATVAELRAKCRAARAQGLHVFPKDGCNNHDARGYCLGHEDGDGDADLVLTWEGGDSHSGLRLRNGVVTKHEVVMALGDECE